MALLATYPDLTQPLGRAHLAYSLSPSSSLMPFPLNLVNQKLALPVMSHLWWLMTRRASRLVVSKGLEGLSGQMEATFVGGAK